ncbi:unnamed protein product [Phaeothamnion confervicola]
MAATQVIQSSHPLRAAAFEPTSGRFFAVGSNDRSLTVYATPTDEELAVAAPGDGDGWYGAVVAARPLHCFRRHHSGSIFCAAWGGGGRLVATGSNDRSVRIATIADLAADSDMAEGLQAEHGGRHSKDWIDLAGHTGTVRSVAFSPTASKAVLLSAGAGDFVCRLWDPVGKPDGPIAKLAGHTAVVFASAFLPDFGEGGHLMATGGSDASLRLWDARMAGGGTSGNAVLNISTGGRPVLSLASRPGAAAGQVVTTHEDGGCALWDFAMVSGGGGSGGGGSASGIRCRPLQQWCDHADECRAASFSPCGDWLLTAAFDGKACVYRGRTRIATAAVPAALTFRRVASMRACSGRILEAVWHPRRPAFLTTSSDGGAVFWAGAVAAAAAPAS